MQFSQTLIFQYNLVILPVKSRDSEVSEYVEHLYNRALVRDVKVPQHSKKLLRVILYMNSYAAVNMDIVLSDATKMLSYVY